MEGTRQERIIQGRRMHTVRGPGKETMLIMEGIGIENAMEEEIGIVTERGKGNETMGEIVLVLGLLVVIGAKDRHVHQTICLKRIQIKKYPYSWRFHVALLP